MKGRQEINIEEKALKLIEDSMNKKCNGLECKVVKNNIDLRLEIIQLNRQIDLMAKQIKIPEPTMKIESFDIKPKTKFGMRYLNKEEVKQYFKELAERKGEE